MRAHTAWGLQLSIPPLPTPPDGSSPMQDRRCLAVRLEFHGSTVIGDTGPPACHELDDAFVLTWIILREGGENLCGENVLAHSALNG